MSGTYTNLLYHLIFSTKDRVPFIESHLRDDLHRYMGGIVRDVGGTPLEIGGVADHVHLLVKLKPTLALADFMRELKSGSSKWMNEEKMRLGKFGWQDGYAAFTVSTSHAPRVKSYIKNQERHHRRASFQEEFLQLLQKHGIEYDERYLWT
jgi:putative transposase